MEVENGKGWGAVTFARTADGGALISVVTLRTFGMFGAGDVFSSCCETGRVCV